MNWFDEVRKKFLELKKENNKISETNIDGFKVKILPNVFSPEIFYESRWFGREMQNIVESGNFLEIGSGTGIISMYISKKGLDVTTVDINKDAVKNTEVNFKENNLPNLETYTGSVYEPLPDGKKFDYVFWNHPFNKGLIEEEDVFLKSVFDHKYKYIEEYISKSAKYLKPKGRIFLGTSNIADLKEIEGLAKKYSYNFDLISKVDRKSEVNNVDTDFRIYEFVKI